MKKRVFGALVAVMVLTFGMTVNAASPTTETTSTDVPAVSVEKEATVSATTGVALSTATISDAAAVAAVNNNLSSADGTATIKAVFDLSDAGAVKNASGTYTVTISLPSAAAGKTYKVLHFTAAGNWEVLGATAGNGTITFDTASFSPFVIVETTGAASGEPSWAAIVRAYGAPWPYGDSATAAVASPKTGEVISVALMVMVIAAAGAAFAAKKYAR